MKLRKIKLSDRDILEKIVSSIDSFSVEEKSVAIELIDESLSEKEQNQYNIFVAEDSELVMGYYCVGPRPLTEGVYDLYWIVVNPDHQGKGVGKELLNHSEQFVKSLNGRLLLAETSSRDDYESTRKFYLGNYYSEICKINDFYKLGDHLIVFGKYL